MTQPHPGGRPRVLDVAQVRYLKRAHKAGLSISQLARLLRCGRATIRRALNNV